MWDWVTYFWREITASAAIIDAALIGITVPWRSRSKRKRLLRFAWCLLIIFVPLLAQFSSSSWAIRASIGRWPGSADIAGSTKGRKLSGLRRADPRRRRKNWTRRGKVWPDSPTGSMRTR